LRRPAKGCRRTFGGGFGSPLLITLAARAPRVSRARLSDREPRLVGRERGPDFGRRERAPFAGAPEGVRARRELQEDPGSRVLRDDPDGDRAHGQRLLAPVEAPGNPLRDRDHGSSFPGSGRPLEIDRT
jgi:hypothetical protein